MGRVEKKRQIRESFIRSGAVKGERDALKSRDRRGGDVLRLWILVRSLGLVIRNKVDGEEDFVESEGGKRGDGREWGNWKDRRRRRLGYADEE